MSSEVYSNCVYGEFRGRWFEMFKSSYKALKFFGGEMLRNESEMYTMFSEVFSNIVYVDVNVR